MAHHSPNDARVTARIPSQVKDTLQKAADLSGITLNQFLVQAALKEAHTVLEAERVINLSERYANTVFGLLENPPAPNTAIQAALQKHQAFFRATKD